MQVDLRKDDAHHLLMELNADNDRAREILNRDFYNLTWEELKDIDALIEMRSRIISTLEKALTKTMEEGKR